MSASLGLFRLQRLDSRLDEIRARLEQIRLTLENDQAILRAKDLLTDAETSRHSVAQALKKAEEEVQKIRIKINQTEANLYSGGVKNPKELQDLQNESAALKRHLATLEDRELEAMLNEEIATKDWQAAANNLENVRSQSDGEAYQLTKEQTELEKEVEKLESERSAALAPLDSKLLSSYEVLRRQRKGLAVTVVSEGACAACGTTLTPAQQQSARSTSQLYYCPTCGRILYPN